MLKSKLLPLLFLPVFAVACGVQPNTPASSSTKEAWNRINDPLRFARDYERHLERLPTSGELAKAPWTDTYWPSYEGGIAARWHDPNAQSAFKYALPLAEQVAKMSQDDLSKLSPAEKYDIYMGRYDFPTVQRERRRTSPRNANWEGICHGWAPAAVNFDEPKPVVVKSPAGIEIPFGSSDVKALLSYYQGEIARAPAVNLGARCNVDLTRFPDEATRDECRDTNAGAFHIVLSNQIGILKQGFVAEVTRDLQVWNHPVRKFESKIVGEQEPTLGAARGTVKEVLVETQMTFTVEVRPEWDALNGTDKFGESTRTYRYRLELDRFGEIIGGDWQDQERPDFLWMQDRPSFRGYFGGVGAIYEASIK